jgi:hypothetical protein
LNIIEVNCSGPPHTIKTHELRALTLRERTRQKNEHTSMFQAQKTPQADILTPTNHHEKAFNFLTPNLHQTLSH